MTKIVPGQRYYATTIRVDLLRFQLKKMYCVPNIANLLLTFSESFVFFMVDIH